MFYVFALVTINYLYVMTLKEIFQRHVDAFLVRVRESLGTEH